jgi:hypothetical protein
MVNTLSYVAMDTYDKRVARFNILIIWNNFLFDGPILLLLKKINICLSHRQILSKVYLGALLYNYHIQVSLSFVELKNALV